MQGLRIANAVLALVTELLLLAAAVVIPLASTLPLWLRIVLAVVLAALLVAVWARFMAPRARGRLAPGPRLVANAVLFAVAAGGLAVVGLLVPALVLAVLAAVRLVLGARLGEV